MRYGQCTASLHPLRSRAGKPAFKASGASWLVLGYGLELGECVGVAGPEAVAEAYERVLERGGRMCGLEWPKPVKSAWLVFVEETHVGRAPKCGYGPDEGW